MFPMVLRNTRHCFLATILLLLGLAAAPGRAASYFLALDLPQQTQQSIVNRQQYISAFLPTNTSVSWHPTNNLHITLQGITNTLASNQLAVVSAAMKQVARAAERFNLADKVANATYKVQEDGYIVFRLQSSQALRDLGDEIYYALAASGIPHDSKQRHFHISIGAYTVTNATDKTILEGLSAWAPACTSFPVTGFVLRHSNYPTIPRIYEEVERYYFRNKAALSLRDYNADGRSDLSVFNAASNYWLIATVPDISTHYTLQAPGANLTPVSGLFDSDDKTDVGVYQATNGTWSLLLSSYNYATQTIVVGGSGFTPVPGDYDADGLTDPAVYQEAEGYWKFLLSSAGYELVDDYLGGPGFTPAIEDYDGDGAADLAVYQQATGAWQIMLSASDYAIASGTFGGPGWSVVSADYDGDGLADPAIFNAGAGEWRVLLSAGGYASASLLLGGSGWTPTPGDFDGDGLADPAVYQESTGTWQVCPSASGYQPVSGSLGGAGWIPAP
jgi:2'-5' RNA ligase